MTVNFLNNKLTFRLLRQEDSNLLHNFLTDGLSSTSQDRFRPHSFDIDTITEICNNTQTEIARYVAVFQNEIIAYFLLKKGYLKHDIPRLSKYEIEFDHENDYTFAPAVADKFQSKGLGSILMSCLFELLDEKKANKIILWGGVKRDNDIAVHFYKKHRFKILGEFEYYGWNLDMALEIRKPNN